MRDMNGMNPSDMRSMIRYFPTMLQSIKISLDTIERVRNIQVQGVSGVCFIGMGGSSIASSYVQSLLSKRSHIPLIVIRDFEIPNYIDNKWVIVAVSYSGNTEETLSALEKINQRGSRIVTIASGGKLSATAADSSVILPQNIQPRAAFPLIFSAILSITEILTGLNMTDLTETATSIEECINQWGESVPKPIDLSQTLLHKIPLFIGASHLIPVAYRAKCQINENSKHPAFYSEIPESNHNEIEGVESRLKDILKPIFLRSDLEQPQLKTRLDITHNMYDNLDMEPINLKIRGKSSLEEMLSVTHYIDMVSVELAEIKGVDPVAVNRINEFKRQLTHIE